MVCIHEGSRIVCRLLDASAVQVSSNLISFQERHIMIQPAADVRDARVDARKGAPGQQVVGFIASFEHTSAACQRPNLI